MSNYNRNDDFVGEIFRDLMDAGDSVFDAARVGRDEVLRAARNSMRSYWGDAATRTSGQYNHNYYSTYNPGQVQPHNTSYTSADRRNYRPTAQQSARTGTYSTGKTTYNGAYSANRTTAPRKATANNTGKKRNDAPGGWDWTGLIFGSIVALGGASDIFDGFSYLFGGWNSLAIDSLFDGLFCVLLGGLLIGNFILKKRREGRYAEYLSILSMASYYSTKKLAKMVGVKESTVERDLKRMIRKGYFGSANVYIDRSLDCIVLDPERFRTEVQQMQTEEAERIRKEEATAKAQQEKKVASEEEKAREEAEKEAERLARGGLPKEYEELLQQLRTLNEQIPDADMTERIYRIESVTRATFLAVRDNPEKLSSIRSFMNYYLPTTIKLLKTYADFDKQTVQGENIRKSKEQIEGMTETLAEAFEKQFDSLFKTEAMDVDTEIRTMDGKLKQDGLVDNIFSGGLASQVKKQ